jgi:tRNA A37 methylthiotransferase MiaB
MRAAGSRIRQQLLSNHLGKQGRVLVERIRPGGVGQNHGRLDNYLPVRLMTGNLTSGEFMSVGITGKEGDVLIAQVEAGE